MELRNSAFLRNAELWWEGSVVPTAIVSGTGNSPLQNQK